MTVTPTVRAHALFVSCLQPSDRPTPAEVAAAIRVSLRGYGGAAGCAAVVAAEYGDHPETACRRMRWALALVTRAPHTAAPPAAMPAAAMPAAAMPAAAMPAAAMPAAAVAAMPAAA